MWSDDYMSISSLVGSLPTTSQVRGLRLTRAAALTALALIGIVVLAAWLRFANLEALGYANHYYSAAVKSMLQSWHNFFYVAAEPGGAVSVDKPPLGLWIQTASAYVFGVNGFGLLLPEILSGILSIVALYHLVNRSFGVVPGLLAALALAITPIVIATDRNNTIDSLLILTLLLAAWAFILTTERGKLRYLLLGAALVGLGFNIKMLQAYLPLPAFFGLYLLGSNESLRRKFANLALATAVLLTVSFSWAVAVELTPADQRPYVGSSGDNSVFSLAFGYNGIQRLLGMGGGGGAGAMQPGRGDDGAMPQPSQSGDGGLVQPGQGDGGVRDDGGRAGFGGGFPGTGQAGALRLFTTPLSKEVSWLLPFGLFSLGLVGVRTRVRWPVAPEHRALVLWGGWLVTGSVFFSLAGFFHEYYLSMLAPALAALVGIGIIALWRLRRQHPWLATGLLLAAAGGTLALQLATASAYVGVAWWLWPAVALIILGALLLVAAILRRARPVALSGFASVTTAMLLIPAVWSGLTTFNSSSNQSLPSAYSGQASGPANRGDTQVNEELLAYLQENTQGATYLMAVPSSMQGSDYIIATGRPVLYMGGFSGQDEVVTADGLAQMVADGELRFIYWTIGGNRGAFGNQSDISEWVTSQCIAVEGFVAATRNAGAPDGTGGAATTDGGFGGGNMEVSLYDCGG
jgi:4-amino-4-deoxy-L-arabinose transferase-like glycosyltransferase